MIQRLLESILRGLVVIHQENTEIAKSLTGGEGIERVWNEVFFSAIKVQGLGDNDSGDDASSTDDTEDK